MRLLEIALLLANVPLLAWCLSGRLMRRWCRVVAAAAFALLILQVVVEGARWHMVPGYLVTIYVLVASWGPPVVQPGLWTAAVGLGLLLTAATLATMLPVFRFPKPTGPYPIGTVTWHLVDAARDETHKNPADEPRELMIQIWYPAQWAGPGQAYRTRAETAFKKAHLTLVRTHAAPGVPVANARPRYPVVLFSPAWTGRRNQNTVQAEELASHGFVVAGIDHPYGSELMIFPDGRTARTTLGELPDYSSDEALQASVRNADRELHIRVADVRFVLDEFERLDRSDAQNLLRGRLDTKRVGVFGHSFGGAVAAEVCRIDPRFQAGMDLDGFLFGEPMTHPVGKPFLFLGDDAPLPSLADLPGSSGLAQRELHFLIENVQGIRQALSEPPGSWLNIRGASHMNFCDSPLFSPIRRLTRAGRIPCNRAMAIINAYVVAFFRTYLNGSDPAELDALPGRYPEVESVPLLKEQSSLRTAAKQR